TDMVQGLIQLQTRSALLEDQLLVDELIHRQRSQLTTDTRTLHTTERQMLTRALRRVQEHHARLDLRTHTLRTLQIIREHRRTQTERRIVRKRHGLLIRPDLEQHERRTEQLLVITAHTRLHTLEHH